MEKYAQNLMTLRGGSPSAQTDAIFGSAARLGQSLDNRDRIRIALWPIVSTERPHDTLGLSAVLAYLLEQWQGVTVYRLFVRFDSQVGDRQWRIDHSQFTVDDWQLEQLDDNVAMWGSLAVTDGQFTLTIEMESELYEQDNDDTFHRTFSGTSLSELITRLPDAARAIAEELELLPPLISPYTGTHSSDGSLSSLLDHMGRWHARLQETLWGKSWPEREAMEALQALVLTATSIDDEFAAWTAGAAAAHGMLPGYEAIADNIASLAAEIPEQFTEVSPVTPIIAQALFNAGETDQALDLLEDQVETKPNDVGPWLMLGELYRMSGRLLDALDVFQRASEAESTSKLLYLRYIDLISVIHLNGLTFDEFVLIEPDDYTGEPDEKLMAYEVAQAMETAFQFDPTDTEILRRQLRQYILLDDFDALWPGFERFLKLEPEGSQIRSLIDDMDRLENLEPLIDMLDSAIEAQPQRADLLVALAGLYIYEGDEVLAIETLEHAEELTDDEELLAEIDRIFLHAKDPEFETHLGDIQALVNAGSKLSHRDLEFLEEAIEQAPNIGEFYLILGKAYQDLDDPDAALETLLDGHEHAPDDPDILAAMGEVLWESDQKSLAFDYLNQGISKHPNHIALLARTGQYLFESGQDEEARLFLARAEMINPRDLFLHEVRQVIARHMAERGK